MVRDGKNTKNPEIVEDEEVENEKHLNEIQDLKKDLDHSRKQNEELKQEIERIKYKHEESNQSRQISSQNSFIDKEKELFERQIANLKKIKEKLEFDLSIKEEEICKLRKIENSQFDVISI